MKNYKLADGSLSTDYEVGDQFEVFDQQSGDGSSVEDGVMVYLQEDDGSSSPYFSTGSTKDECCDWSGLIPTPETKRKVLARKLDKDKGMSKFTKDDLKDGMVIKLRSGCEYYICGSYGLNKDGFFNLVRFESDLTHDKIKSRDIIRVTDRDGTVLFEREPETKQVTLNLTQEQIDSLRQQGIF